MKNGLSKILFDEHIETGLDVLRVSAGVENEIERLLQQLERDLLAKLKKGNLTDWGTARTKRLLLDVDGEIRAAYEKANGLTRDTTVGIYEHVGGELGTALSASVGGQIAIERVLTTPAHLARIADDTLIQGAANAAWWKKQTTDTIARFNREVKAGLIAAETTAQINTRVAQRLGITRANANTLVHTSIQTVANQAREDVMNANSDIIAGREWVATLDMHTCIVCGALDNKRWTTAGKPIEHGIPYQQPPKHFRCRCAMIPILKSWEELGINLPEIPAGTRASMQGQVNDKSFGEWLSRQSTDKKEAVLGKGRAELWESGVITFDQLINGRGNIATLEQLRRTNR